MTRQDQQVEAGAFVDDGSWLERLHGELRSLLAPVFAQARSRLAAFAYIGALLGEPGDRKSCWQLAERAGHATPRRMQALLAGHAWDWKAALKALQRFILAHLSDAEAIVVLDETAEPYFPEPRADQASSASPYRSTATFCESPSHPGAVTVMIGVQLASAAPAIASRATAALVPTAATLANQPPRLARSITSPLQSASTPPRSIASHRSPRCRVSRADPWQWSVLF